MFLLAPGNSGETVPPASPSLISPHLFTADRCGSRLSKCLDRIPQGSTYRGQRRKPGRMEVLVNPQTILLSPTNSMEFLLAFRAKASPSAGPHFLDKEVAGPLGCWEVARDSCSHTVAPFFPCLFLFLSLYLFLFFISHFIHQFWLIFQAKEKCN